MTKNTALLLFLATILFLASCVSDNCLFPEHREPGESDGDRNVSVRLVPSTVSAATRGVSRPICDGEPVQLNHGMLYLVSSQGVIIRHFPITERLSEGGDPTNLIVNPLTGVTMGGNINIECLEGAGQDLGLVPGSITRVVIVGNSQVALPTAGNIDSIVSELVSGNVSGSVRNTIASQHDPFTTHGVNMFADEPLGYDGTVSGTRTYAAEMVLAPLVARFEVRQITGMGLIRSFTLDGIFIDRYYPQMRRNHTLPPTANTQVSHGTTPGIGNFGAGNHHFWAAYTSTARLSGALFTQYPNGLPADPRTNDGVIVRPGGYTPDHPCQGNITSCTIDHTTDVPNVWGFQVFARYYRGAAPAVRTATAPPAIVIRVSNVTVYTGVGSNFITLTEPQYVTVGSYTIASGANAGAPLTDILASNVYRINNITFTEGDLSPRPNLRPIDADVTIVLGRWNDRPMNPAGFRQPNPVGTAIAPGQTWSFPLGAATNAYCNQPNSLYLWQYSHVGGMNPADWTYIQDPSAPSATYRTLSTTGALFRTTYFRRVAIDACNNARRITSAQARVEVIPRQENRFSHITAFTSVMYDFQSQPLEVFVGYITPCEWQWQVSTDNVTFTNIPGATGTVWTTTSGVHHQPWTLPVDFIHNPLFDGVDTLFFRAIVWAPNDKVTQISDNTLRIRFIRTTYTATGGLRNFREGFGICPRTGTRYAVMRRARHNAATGLSDPIRVALLNVGATNYDGGLGYLIQWGRQINEQPGHHQIGWHNHAANRATHFTPGAGGTSPNMVRSTIGSSSFNTDGQAIGTSSRYSFLMTNASPPLSTAGDWSFQGADADNLWGAGFTSGNNHPGAGRDAVPLTLSGATRAWGARAQRNNPCDVPGGTWRVPSVFDWRDMISTVGTGTGTLTATFPITIATSNAIEWLGPSANASGGLILTNRDNGASIFLPSAGIRTIAGTRGSVNFGMYWSSTQSTRAAGWHLTFSGSSIWIPRNTLAGDHRYRMHGFSVRCVW